MVAARRYGTILQQAQEIYRSMGLTAWAENIGTISLSRLTPEKRATIEQEIKDGAISIIMPDKNTQLNTTVEQFKTAFKPTWIKEGEEQQVNDAYFGWDHFIHLITTKATELVDGVPDHPYFSMMHPTQKPDPRTTNKTVDQQLREFAVINTERAIKHQEPVHITNPHEYGALQTVHSRLLQEMMTPSNPATLTPIDATTWTRFINLPLSPDRYVPYAYFSPVSARAGFDGGDADHRYAGGGLRLAVRIGF